LPDVTFQDERPATAPIKKWVRPNTSESSGRHGNDGHETRALYGDSFDTSGRNVDATTATFLRGTRDRSTTNHGGVFLRLLRHELGSSQEQLARNADSCSKDSIRKLEQGAQQIGNTPLAERLARSLGTATIEFLIAGSGTESQTETNEHVLLFSMRVDTPERIARLRTKLKARSHLR
jgi:transcriptional regulator with XRE-family HTH domain